MAGLGETCTHIAAVLFYLEATARIQGTTTTCTQQTCQRIIPAYFKKIEYLPIKDLDFTSALGKKRKLDQIIDSTTSVEAGTSKCSKMYPATGKKPTEAEMADFFDSLSKCCTKPAVLSVVPTFSDKYVPKSSLVTFPKPLSTLYQSELLQLNYDELLARCELVSTDITQEMADAVEKETRAQNQSKFWFKQRAGRVTASKMRAVCHTNLAHPSPSLIKTIRYPEEFSFSSKQTAYGSKNEKKASEMYYKITVKDHLDFKLSESGLVINPKWPFVGASPDGVVSCHCCGKGVLEVKCPYSHQNTDIQDAASQDNRFCLKKTDGFLQLDNSHAYYYQIQTQLFVCDIEYCDFCVCTFVEDDESKGLHIERIYKNEAFWLECISKAQQFFKTCLLPEILGKYYTRPNSSLTQVTDSGQPSSNDSLKSKCGDTDHSQTLGNSSNSSESIDMSDASGTNRLSRTNTTNDADGTSRAFRSKSTNGSRAYSSNTTNDASGTSRVSSSNTTNDADGISRASRSNNMNDASGTSRSRVPRSSTLDLRPCTSNSMRSVPDDHKEPTYCYCNGPDKGKMIACDNPACPFKWFHVRCLGIRLIPKVNGTVLNVKMNLP